MKRILCLILVLMVNYKIFAIERKSIILEEITSHIKFSDPKNYADFQLEASYFDYIASFLVKLLLQYSNFELFGNYSRYLSTVKERTVLYENVFASGILHSFINQKKHFGRLGGIFIYTKNENWLAISLNTGTLGYEWNFSIETSLLFSLKNKSKFLLISLENSKKIIYQSGLTIGIKFLWSYNIEPEVQSDEFEHMEFGLAPFIDWQIHNSNLRLAIIERLYLNGVSKEKETFLSNYGPAQFKLSWTLNFL